MTDSFTMLSTFWVSIYMVFNLSIHLSAFLCTFIVENTHYIKYF